MLTYVYDFYDWIAKHMLIYVNWYVIIFIFALFIWMISIVLSKLSKNEIKKRKKIIKEIDLLRKEKQEQKNKEKEQDNEKDNEKDNEQTGIPFADMFFFYQKLSVEETNEFREKALSVVKKYNGKPMRIVWNILVQSILFITLLYYLKNIDTVEYQTWIPICSVILSFFTYVTRKRVILNIVMALFSYWIYIHLNGVVTYFFLCYLGLHFINKRIIEKYFIKKEEEKEVE